MASSIFYTQQNIFNFVGTFEKIFILGSRHSFGMAAKVTFDLPP